MHVTTGMRCKTRQEPNLCHLLTRMWLEIRNNIILNVGKSEKGWIMFKFVQVRCGVFGKGNTKIRWGWHFFWFPHTISTWLLYILPFATNSVSFCPSYCDFSVSYWLPIILRNSKPRFVKIIYSPKAFIKFQDERHATSF